MTMQVTQTQDETITELARALGAAVGKAGVAQSYLAIALASEPPNREYLQRALDKLTEIAADDAEQTRLFNERWEQFQEGMRR